MEWLDESAEPEELDGHLGREEPLLVVHSRASEVVQTRAGAWVLLYPDGENRATISIAGRQADVADIQFADLLGVLDGLATPPTASTTFAVGESK